MIKVHPSFFVHPGPWLRSSIVEPHGLNITTAAAHLGVKRGAMSSLLNGRSALTADMALRFEKAFGVKAETLMRMRVSHELAAARQRASGIAVKRLVVAK